MLKNIQNSLFVKMNANINPRLRYHTPTPPSIGNNPQFKKLININLKNINNSPLNDNSIINHYPTQKNNSYQSEINFLKLKYKDYETATNEINYLTQELKKLNETLKNKNAIICEFQQLTQMSKNKLESLINNDNKDRNYPVELGNIFERIDKLEKENINLSKKLMFLENENKSLAKQFKNVGNIKNEILKTENFVNRSKKMIEFQGFKDKNDENIENDLFEIKNKYYFLEKQAKEKDENIKKLSIINKNLVEQLKSNKISKIENGNKQYKLNRKKNSSTTLDNIDYQYNHHSNDISVHSQGGKTNLTGGALRPNTGKKILIRSYNPKLDSDEAINYSNYLLNNLKNDISKMKFES